MGEEEERESNDVNGAGAVLMASASFSGEGTVTITWDAISLTIAVALFGLLATVSGAFIGASRWPWRLAYVVAWAVVVVAVFWVRRIRERLIFTIQRRIPGLPPPRPFG